MAFEIVELPRIGTREEAAGHPDYWLFEGVAAVSIADSHRAHGWDDFGFTADSHRSWLNHQEFSHRHSFAAVESGEVVGYSEITVPKTANLSTVELFVVIHPDHRGRGIGTALLQRSEALSGEYGRTVFQTWLDTPPPAPDEQVLVCESGGSLPSGDTNVQFALNHGYQLAQIEHMNTQELPIPREVIEGWRDSALPKAADYHIHTWSDGVPDEWLAGYAELMTRTSTDVPAGALSIEEDPWDVPRAARAMTEYREGGYQMIVTAAERDGQLAGVTYYLARADFPESAIQSFTIVLHSHRGHRLGLLMKAVNLLALLEEMPAVKRIHTWNAAENDNMLAINHQMGFRLDRLEGAFEKRIA